MALGATCGWLLGGIVAACWGVNRVLRPSLDAADIVVSTVRRGDVANTVNAAGVVSTLMERRLVKIVGRKQVVGRPFLYGTTKEFLERFAHFHGPTFE